MQHQWIRWINGYLIIILKGKRFERLINLALHKGMYIWNIVRFDEQQGSMAIRLKDFIRLKPLLKETGCRVHIKRKSGLPFFFRHVRQRSAFFIGFACFFIVLFVLSHMIWSVEIVGVETIPQQKVLEAADKLGVQSGKFSFSLDDPDKIQAKLMELIPEASWIGFRMDGTKAQIRIVEKVIPEDKKNQNPKHIVAKKSAIIRTIFASQGKPLVRTNDFVRKGDVLISGWIGKEQSPLAVSAEGRIEGEVWYDTEVIIPKVQKQLTYTGESQQNVYITFGSYAWKVWGFQPIQVEQYETKVDSWNLNLYKWKMPIGWKAEKHLFTQMYELKRNEHDILALAKQAARQEIMMKMDGGGYVKEEKVLHQSEDNDKVYIKMHVIAMEDIAQEQSIQPTNAEGE